MTTVEWTAIVDEFYPQIFRFTLQFLGNQAEAEDATQDTFIKAFLSLSSLRKGDSLKAWLYSIARNLCIDRLRWWKRRLRITDQYATTAYASLQIKEPLHDLRLSLRKIVAGLPLKQREVFILRHWHDFSTEETAKFLGLQTGTVKSHLQRAVEKVKKELQNE